VKVERRERQARRSISGCRTPPPRNPLKRLKLSKALVDKLSSLKSMQSPSARTADGSLVLRD